MQPPTDKIDIYKIIAEHAADPIFVTDRAGRVVYANPMAEQTFGYSMQELAGKCLHDTIHHHHRDGMPYSRADCPLSRAYVTGEAIKDRDVTFIRKDGSFITMSASSAPVQFDGEPAGRVIFARDITQRVEAEQALAASERRLRLITDSLPQMIWQLASNGSVDFINPHFTHYTGITPGGQLDYAAFIHADDLQRSQEAMEQARRMGRDFRIEHRLRAADGSYRWFLTHGVALKDADGVITAWYGSSTNIDDMHRTLDALRKSRETLRLATEATDLGLWDFYPDTGEFIWNDINRRLFGVASDDVVTMDDFMEQLHRQDRARVEAATQHAMQPDSDGHFDIEFRAFRRDDGQLRWFRAYGQSIRDAAGHFTRFIGTSLDITEAKLAEQRVFEASRKDVLTGLPNRALLFEYCEHLLAIAQRTGSNGALLFIDLDRFKPINDTYGHDVGDQVLQQVAKRLAGCTRQEDIVGRLGGDEFVVALPHPDDIYGPATVARNIVERISAPYHIGGLQLHLSPSIGISLYPRDGDTLDALIKCADTAMYEAKKAGRATYKFYTPSLEQGMDRYAMVEQHLRHALDHNALQLHYQPVMDMESGMPIGVEALLRLPIPDGEILVPEQFLHIAEAAGLTNQVGEWVAREACRQHQQWRDAGLGEMSIAINVAPQQFRQRSFVPMLVDSVRHSGMDPSCLQIELKESTVLDDVPDAIASLREIRSLGIRVALDDFGVGYSSVGLLSSLPLDKLKIDQSFVGAIAHDEKSRTIADTVLALGRSLHLTVVGEGIESADAFDYLRDHGCDQAQGYFFSHPLSADDFERWYREDRSMAHAVH